MLVSAVMPTTIDSNSVSTGYIIDLPQDVVSINSLSRLLSGLDVLVVRIKTVESLIVT